jgi:glycolate oxidase
MILNNYIWKIQSIVGAGCCNGKRRSCLLCLWCNSKPVFAGCRSISEDAEISEIMKLASWRVHVIPRGSGSGMTGGSVAVMGGVVLVMTRLNPHWNCTDNLIAFAEPGVITAHFQRSQSDFLSSIHPAQIFNPWRKYCWMRRRAEAVKYGVTRDYVLAQSGSPNRWKDWNRCKTAKGVVGYDLTRLLIVRKVLWSNYRDDAKAISLQTVRTMTAVFMKSGRQLKLFPK